MGVIKGDTRSVDYSSCAFLFSLGLPPKHGEVNRKSPETVWCRS